MFRHLAYMSGLYSRRVLGDRHWLLAYTGKPLSFAMTLDENLDIQSFVRRCTAVPVLVSQYSEIACVELIACTSSLHRRQLYVELENSVLLICRNLKKLGLILKT